MKHSILGDTDTRPLLFCNSGRSKTSAGPTTTEPYASPLVTDLADLVVTWIDMAVAQNRMICGPVQGARAAPWVLVW